MDIEMKKDFLALGRLAQEKKRVEYARSVSCELCHDYYILASGKRSYRNQTVFLCSCAASRNSEHHKTKSITLALEKGEVFCTNCERQIVEFDETRLLTSYDGDEMLLIICKYCEEKMAPQFSKQLDQMEKEIKAMEKFESTPIISKEELMRRFLKKRGDKDGG